MQRSPFCQKHGFKARKEQGRNSLAFFLFNPPTSCSASFGPGPNQESASEVTPEMHPMRERDSFLGSCPSSQRMTEERREQRISTRLTQSHTAMKPQLTGILKMHYRESFPRKLLQIEPGGERSSKIRAQEVTTQTLISKQNRKTAI